mmetsp:Transcript_5882/g.18712  ORF Transcript_5882/g.18712 Transcript_5882/m.18712 type:complete len:206 (-) Transcript_5882:60-677(-)
MACWRAALLSLVCLALLRGSAGARVAELDASNFEAEVSAHPAYLVVFHAPWCAHCKAVEPVLNALAAKNVPVGRCDGTVQRALASRFAVNGFPSIYYIRKSGWRTEVRKYDGGRSLESFESYLAAGWRSTPELPLMRSPYGPAGALKGALITAGARLLDVHVALQGGGKISWWMASLILAFAVIVSLTFIVYSVVALSPDHPHAQ